MQPDATHKPQESASVSTHSNAPLVNMPIKDGNRTTTISEQNKEIKKVQYKESANPQPDFISFFKAKLKNTHFFCKSCTLWISVHIALIFIFLDIIENAIAVSEFLQYGIFVWGTLELIFVLLQMIVFVMAFRGIYTCDDRFIAFQFILLWIVWIVWIPIVIQILSFFGTSEQAIIDLVGAVLSIILNAYCLFIFRRVYLWAKYFKEGGVYDVNMLKPNSRIQHSRRDKKVSVDV